MSCFTMLMTIAEKEEKQTNIKFDQTTDPTLLSVPKSEEGPLFDYVRLIPITEGPMPPPISEVNSMGYVSPIQAETPQENAGGFTSTLVCQQALRPTAGVGMGL